MKKRYRFLIILAVLAVGFYFVWPSIKWYFMTAQADKDMAESSRNQIKVYAQERADSAIKTLLAMKATDPLPADFSFLASKAQGRYKTAGRSAPSAWTVQNVLQAYSSREDITGDAEAWYRDQMFALKDLKNQTMQLGLDLRGGMYVTIQVDYASYEQTNKTSLNASQRRDKMAQTMEVLRNKIDQFGLTDPSIRTQGDDRIIIEIPGTSDPENVRRFIMGKGSLTFHIVDEDAVAKVKEYAAANPGVLLDAAGNVKDTGVLAVIPKGDVLRGVFAKDAYGLDDLKGYTVLHEEIGLNGTEITNAQVGRDPLTGEPTVNFILTSAGGETFYKLTSANVGKRLAVALDDKVKAQATIQEPIRDQVRVNGFTAAEATDLALTLRTGSLPGPAGDHQPAGNRRLPRPGRDQPGHQGQCDRHRAGHGVHAPLLPPGGSERGRLPAPSPVHQRRDSFGVRVHPHPLCHRGSRPHHRNGRGRERADLREDEGRVAAGEDQPGHREPRVLPRLLGDPRLERDDHHRGARSYPARQGQHPGLRRHPADRQPRHPVRGGIRFPAHFRLRARRAQDQEDPAHLEKAGMKRVIRFSRARYWFFGFSSLLILIGIAGYIVNRGLNLGVDFKAGIEFQFQVAPASFTVQYAGLDKTEISIPAGEQALTSPGDIIFTVTSAKDGSKRSYPFRYSAYATVRDLADAITKGVSGVTVDMKGDPAASPADLEPLPRPADITNAPYTINRMPGPGRGAETSIADVRALVAVPGRVHPAGGRLPGPTRSSSRRSRSRRVPAKSTFQQDTQKALMQTLEGKYGAGQVILKSTTFVGARMAQSLATQTIWLVLIAVALILLYMTLPVPPLDLCGGRRSRDPA